MNGLVWYVAYGSNLAADRLAAYLAGGAVPGAVGGPGQHGARDATPPLASRTVVLPHDLVFAAESARWGGGGVAFVDPRPGGPTPARAWLLSARQFADVYAQENGRAPSTEIDDALAAGGLDRGWYRHVLDLGTLDGHPVRTFTHPDPASLGWRAPHASYVAVMTRGWREAHHGRFSSP